MKPVHVSDHALLRWLQRVEGVDVEAIRRRIARAVRRGVDEKAEGVRVEGVTFKVQYNPDGAVVTTTHTPHTRPHLAQPRVKLADMQRQLDADSAFLVARPTGSMPATFNGQPLDEED